MFSFTDDEHTMLTDARAITTDAKGREVLVGLTLEETAFYIDYARHFLDSDREVDPAQTDRVCTLMHNHLLARLDVVESSIQRRRTSATH